VAGLLGSFINATVIDPTDDTSDANPNVIPASPQGGYAIVAWDYVDEEGGGNMVISDDVLQGGASYDMWVYLDTTPFAEAGGESATYGLVGTCGTYYNYPNPTDAAGFSGDIVTVNGNTGIGWVLMKESDTSDPDLMVLVLANFGPGGDSSGDPGATTPRDWSIITTIDLNGEASGWYRLGLTYDSATGAAVGHFDGTDYPFTTATGLTGGFYVGYRESLSLKPTALRPPTFDSVTVAP
jgi:hypothetical protein